MLIWEKGILCGLKVLSSLSLGSRVVMWYFVRMPDSVRLHLLKKIPKSFLFCVVNHEMTTRTVGGKDDDCGGILCEERFGWSNSNGNSNGGCSGYLL